MIGELVGPHRIVELLGRGGASEVYRAYHMETSRDVALKILSAPPDERTRKRFAREGQALKVLHHPNIIEFLAVGEHEGRPYYTMPFVRVLNLQEVMFQRFQVDKGRFSEDEVLRILVDVARALRYAHGKGVIHRDVKPGNILVDQNFRPILCDFGLARLAQTETVTTQGTMVGTPQYMAPEQLQGKRADHRSDLYSLGLVAYELASGGLPLGDGEPLAAAVRRLTEAIPPLAAAAPHLAPDLAALVMDLLAREPRDRPATTSDVVRRLEALPGAPPPLEAEEAETTADTPPPPEATPPDAPASRGATPWVAGALALAFAGGGVALWMPRPLELEARCRVEPEAQRATLAVETDRPVRVAVRYGRPGRMDGLEAPPGSPRTSQVLVLDALEPGREYAFALVFEAADGRRHEEAPRVFRTAALVHDSGGR